MERFAIHKTVLVFLIFLGLSAAMRNTMAGETGKKSNATKNNPPQNIVLHEGFENGIPSGWIQTTIYCPNIICGYWSTRTGAGIVSPPSTFGIPEEAAVGEKNLVFQFQTPGTMTWLTTVPINLEFIINPVLTFWHAQAEWDDGEFDQLSIYYRKGENGPLQVLRRYTSPVNDWEERYIPLNDHDTYEFYLVFEGLSNWGSGICIDDLKIIETGYIAKELDSFETEQASLAFIPTSTVNNPILRSTIRVTGNTGDLVMDTYTAHSLNTNDPDVTSVKLYYTSDHNFNTNYLVGQASGFNNGSVTFLNMGLDLPTGYSYLWLVYDLGSNVEAGNLADAYIPANGVEINGQKYPATNHSPFGERTIIETIFYDDFDTNKGWILTGEWQREVPQGKGGGTGNNDGSYGHPGASYPVVGSRVLGTDITGLGEFPGNYEMGLDTLAYLAISPTFNSFYYKDVTLTFHRWLNVEPADYAFIHISTDHGVTWQPVWRNTNFINSLGWTQVSTPLKLANRMENVRIRFGIGPTDNSNQYSGWNIDNLIITGSFVTHDVGVVQWVGPDENCGMTSEEEVVVVVKNFGAREITDKIPLGFSLDGGLTWHMDTMDQDIPVGGSVIHTFAPKADFSVPGRYNNILVKPFWELDQYAENDTLHHQLFSIPFITPPYSELFLEDDGLWTAYGSNVSWEWGTPKGSHITHAQAGQKAWVTNPNGVYLPMEVSTLVSPCFNLSTMEYPVLEFYYQTHTPTGTDGFNMQYTSDNGNTWQPVDHLSDDLTWGWYEEDTDITSLNEGFSYAPGWDGSTDGWKRARVVMGNAIAQKEKLRFRLNFASHNFDPETSIWEGIAFDAVSIYDAPNDVGVVALSHPVDACELSENQVVSVIIENFGINVVPAGTQIPVGFEAGEETTVFEYKELTADLLPGETTEFTFENTFDLSAVGKHNIVSYTLLPGDSDFYNPGSHNDTLTTLLTVFGYPDFTMGGDIYTQQGDTLVLDAGPGFVNYLWNDGSEEQTFHVTTIHSNWYKVTITDEFGCSVTDSLEVIARDLQIVAITEPVSSCELTDEEYVVVRVKNAGPDPYPAGAELPIGIYMYGELLDEMVYVLNEDLLPGASFLTSFENRFDFSYVGEYPLMVKNKLRDALPDNDILEYTIFVHGYPQPNIGDTIFEHNHTAVLLDGGEEYVGFLWQDDSEDRFYIPSNPFSDWYHATVTDIYGCKGTDSVYVLTYDIEIAELLNPIESCERTGEENFVIRLINHGPETLNPGMAIPFSLYFQNGLLAQDTLIINEPWLADDEIIFAFSQVADMQALDTYQVMVTKDMKDAVSGNNSIELAITVHGYPEVYLPPYITTNEPEMIMLDPGGGHHAYLWHDETTEQVFDVQTWGEHTVTVSNAFGCSSIAITTVYPEVFDMAVDMIVAPKSVCDRSPENEVTIQIKNSGYMPILPGTELVLNYSVNGTEVVEEAIELLQPLMPWETKQYTFQKRFLAPAGKTGGITAGVWFEGDELDDNNELTASIDILPLPQPSLGGNLYTPDPSDIVLSTGEDFVSYEWHDGSLEPTYEVKSVQTQTYSVWVTDENGCANGDTIMVVTYDLQMDEILSPKSHCVLSSQEPVNVRVRNMGNDTLQAGFNLSLGFRVGAQAVGYNEKFELEESWLPGTYRNFTFNRRLDFTGRSGHDLKVYVATPNAVAITDTLLTKVETTGRPEVVLGPDIYTSRPDTITLNAGAGFASYLWHNGFTQQNLPVVSYGWKWVTVTDEYGCTGSDTLYVGYFVPVEEVAMSIPSRVYPNPARDLLVVEMESVPAGGLLIEINDSRGRVLVSSQITDDATFSKELDISGIASGIYFVSVSGVNTRQTHKITIIR